MASNTPIVHVAEGDQKVHIDDLDLPAEVKEKFRNSNELNILLAGKYQVGKSTLINSLLYDGKEYKQYAKEGAAKPTTMEVRPYKLELANGVSCNIYDTVGLRDGVGRDIGYVRKMAKECKSIHLVIYCTKLDEPLRPDDVKAIRMLTDGFGKKLWENAVFALTFANQVQPADPSQDEKVYFEKRLREKISLVQECLTEKRNDNGVGLDESVVRIIQFPPTATVRQKGLPGIDDWRANFWACCFQVMKEEGQAAILKIHWGSPRFIVTIVGSAAATTSGSLSVVGGGGAIVAGTVLCSTGILLPLGIGLIVGGAVAGALGLGSTVGGAMVISRMTKKD